MRPLAAGRGARFVVLARHGRTFVPQQTAVWLGRAQDDALSTPGLGDARLLGEGLVAAGWPVSSAWVSPQRRARQTLKIALAELTAAQMPVPREVQEDERLSELDFGRWTGRSRDELTRAGEGDAVTAWTEQRRWPKDAAFVPSEREVREDAQTWLRDCHRQIAPTAASEAAIALVVSHGARLRFVLEGLQHDQSPAPPHDKLGCGQVGVWRVTARGFCPVAWNVAPAALGALLAREA